MYKDIYDEGDAPSYALSPEEENIYERKEEILLDQLKNILRENIEDCIYSTTMDQDAHEEWYIYKFPTLGISFECCYKWESKRKYFYSDLHLWKYAALLYAFVEAHMGYQGESSSLKHEIDRISQKKA